jgi:hypothetical protein
VEQKEILEINGIDGINGTTGVKGDTGTNGDGITVLLEQMGYWNKWCYWNLRRYWNKWC